MNKFRWLKRLIHPDEPEPDIQENEIRLPMDASGCYVYAKLQYFEAGSWHDVQCEW